MKKAYFETVLMKYLDLNTWIFLVVVLIVCFLEKGDNIVDEGEGDGEDDGNNEDGEEDVDEEEEKGDDEFLSNMYKNH